MEYSKPTLTIDEQISLLKGRNLIINDNKKAKLTLSTINYYRLSAYLYPYRIIDNPDQKFISNISLEDILKLYSFDRKLRLLVFDAIERIEIAFRTQFVLEMSLKYHPFWYFDENLFYENDIFKVILKGFEDEYLRSKEVFIAHYKNKYDDPKLPPSWMSIELFTLGKLSKHYSNLKYLADKKMIAKYFQIDYSVFESWIHSISYIRNICAHHNRLWNRVLAIKPVTPKKTSSIWLTNQNINPQKLYLFLSILKYLLNIINPETSFSTRLKNLFLDYKNVDIAKMGFPIDWQEEELWK